MGRGAVTWLNHVSKELHGKDRTGYSDSCWVSAGAPKSLNIETSKTVQRLALISYNRNFCSTLSPSVTSWVRSCRPDVT
jgi:hypothetical protein